MNIPYLRLSSLALEQRGKLIRRAMIFAGIDTLGENEFGTALSKAVSEFFSDNPELYYVAEYYYA